MIGYTLSTSCAFFLSIPHADAEIGAATTAVVQ